MLFLCVESKHCDNINWDSNAVDNIIQAGTQLHSQIVQGRENGSSYLLINELPNCVAYNATNYLCKPLSCHSGLLGTEQSDMTSLTYHLNDAIHAVFSISCFCFMTIGPASNAFTSAVCKSIYHDKYKCFDSHSRTAFGTFSPGGKSVVLSIESSAELARYVIALAKSLFGVDGYRSVPFEFTPVICEPLSAVYLAESVNNDQSNEDSSCQSANPSVNNDCNMPVAEMRDSNHSKNTQPQYDIDGDTIGSSDLCPTVCSREQFNKWKGIRPWLCAKQLTESDSLIGVTCLVCSEVGSLINCRSLDSAKERLSISKEWICGKQRATAKSYMIK